MSDVTQILSKIAAGDQLASRELLPLVYDELRKLAAARMAQENPGQTLQATALVHEAYVRLVDNCKPQAWDSRGHFFTAAAEAMRRILVESARRKARPKHGGGMDRITLSDAHLEAAEIRSFDLLALDEALEKLAAIDPRKAELVKLRFFAGLSGKQAAGVLGIAQSTAILDWAYAKTWLRVEIEDSTQD